MFKNLFICNNKGFFDNSKENVYFFTLIIYSQLDASTKNVKINSNFRFYRGSRCSRFQSVRQKTG